MIHLPDAPFGAEAWALIELEIPVGLTLESGNQILQVSVSAGTPDGQPVAFLDQTLTLKAVSAAGWDAILPDRLVVARQAELAAAAFLVHARAAAEQGDWSTLQQMVEQARQSFADHPWVSDMLEEFAEIAKVMDSARFRKEALYSSRKMSSRLSAKDEIPGHIVGDAEAASYLRRKRAQGKAQFEPRPEDHKP